MDVQERQQFVRSHRVCVFGYNRREHGPAMSLVYYRARVAPALYRRDKPQGEPGHGALHALRNLRDAAATRFRAG